MKNKGIFSIWPIYLVGLSSIGILFSWGVDLKTKPTAAQSIDFCIVAEKVNTSGLKKNVKNNLSSFDIKQVDTHVLSNKSSKFNYLYNAVEDTCDVYILPSSILEGSEFEKYNSSFNKLEVTAIPENLYSYNGYTYGYKVYDYESKEGYGLDYITYGECDYYMFLNIDSSHQEVTSSSVASFYDVLESLK